MSRFDEDIVIGKPFGAVFLGVQWLDGVLQQGWSEKVEHKTKSGRYLGTFNRERWENVPGVPPGPPKAAEGKTKTKPYLLCGTSRMKYPSPPAGTEAYVLTFNSTGKTSTCPNWKRACLILRGESTDHEIAAELEEVARQIRSGTGDRIRHDDETFNPLFPTEPQS